VSGATNLRFPYLAQSFLHFTETQSFEQTTETEREEPVSCARAESPPAKVSDISARAFIPPNPFPPGLTRTHAYVRVMTPAENVWVNMSKKWTEKFFTVVMN